MSRTRSDSFTSFAFSAEIPLYLLLSSYALTLTPLTFSSVPSMLMGSLPPLPLPENLTDTSRIFASFCAQGTPPWLESYTPSDNTWRHDGFIPGISDDHFLKGFAMVSLGDSVYVIGGRLCRKESKSEVDLAVRSDVIRYNTSSHEWTICAPLLLPRFDFACAACDGKIYVAGGQCVLARGRGTSAAEFYDPTQDQWDPLPKMSTLRYKCVGVTWHGRFHVVGGFAVREDSESRTMLLAVERSSVEVYDTGREEWELRAGMWQLDVPPNQIVSVEGQRLFSSGDCLNTWKGHIESYDGKLNIWNIVDRSHIHDLSSLLNGSPDPLSAENSYGSPRFMQTKYLTMSAIGTDLYFLAGYRVPGESFRSLSVVHTFDTSTTTDEESWRTSEAISVDEDRELCAHCCVLQN